MSRNIKELEERIRHLAAAYPFAVHWQVRDIAGGQRIGEADRRVLGAFSTRKVSVLLACLVLVRQKRLSLDEPLVITDQLKDGVQAGIMRNLSPGIELTLRDHLTQMMVTSDNICTQLVFAAMERANVDALQWVNDYCAQTGMYDTLHREVFPRSAELDWQHSNEAMTVTSAHDQALLLERLAHGCTDEAAATVLGLTTELCQLAVDMMSQIFTPMLGARVTNGRFVEKNGRGIRGLSQVGLLLDNTATPVASVAVFAESIPVELWDEVPGRARAMEFFVEMGQLIEEHFLDGTPVPVVPRHIVEPDFWEQEFGELIYVAENGRAVNSDMTFPFSGVGKVFLAVLVASLAQDTPQLLEERFEITDQHRSHTETGALAQLTGALQVSVDDAMRLILGSGDGAATLGLLDHLQHRGIAVLDQARTWFADLPNTEFTGVETRHSAGDGLLGMTTAQDVLQVLRDIIDHHGHVMSWMTTAFEPGGLACALPGYGPHTVEHWTVSTWSKSMETHAAEGRTSVLILNGPNGHFGLVAHAPIGTLDVCAKFGSLGLSSVPCARVERST